MDPPTAPVLTDPVTNTTSIALAWFSGIDPQTGIREHWAEYRRNGSTDDWTRVVVPYFAGQAISTQDTFTGLSAGTPYDVRVGAVDNAVNVTYSAVKTVSTLGTSADLEPGGISIDSSPVTLDEGSAFSVALRHFGAGLSSPIVEADWQITGLAEGAPSPANGTVQWASGQNSTQLVQGTAGLVSANRSGVFRIAAVRALTGTIQPTLGTAQIAFTVREAAAAAAKKWHPGHYLKAQGNHAQSPNDPYLASVTTQLARINDSEHIKGAYVAYAWGVLNPTGLSFNWDPVYDHLAALPAGKKLIVCLEYKSYGATQLGELVPADLRSQAFPRTSGNNPVGWVGAVWLQSVMDRFIAFVQAFAQEFDSNPAVELLMLGESSPSFGAGAPSGYTAALLGAQLRRLYAAMGVAFTRTNAVGTVNSLAGEAASLIEAAYQAGLGRGSPDAMDDNGARIFRGEQVAGSGTTVRDYRGLVPHCALGSAPVLGGFDDEGPPSNIINWAQTNDITHLPWISTATGVNSWTNILSAIAADSLLYTDCPSVYSACDIT